MTKLEILKAKGYKVLTKAQADTLHGYAGMDDCLDNGQQGYCEETQEVIVSCGSCGDFIHINLSDLK